MAVRGPVRPTEMSQTLVYNLKCVKVDQPVFAEIEFTCVNETVEFILSLVAELGRLLKTNATCCRIRCIRYGFFTLDNALLPKHVNLENALNQIYANKVVIEENKVLLKRSSNFREPKKIEFRDSDS